MTRNIHAQVDLGALRHNLRVARAAAPHSRLLAVVKADAYGHGLLPVARAAGDLADGFAVSCLEEAIPLREAGIDKPILLLEGFFDPSELPVIERYGLDCALHADWQLEMLERARVARPIPIWLKIDSGMHRLGVRPEEARAFYWRLRDCPAVDQHVRLMTHLAYADDRSDEYTHYQLENFERATEGLPGERSIGNSAGVLAWPRTRSDWVRPGIMLYGASPFADGQPSPAALRPVMTLRTRLVAVRQCRKGDRIGYAGRFECPEDMPVGVVAAGYGDGYPRHAPCGTPVLVDGRRAGIVGRVSMDMLCVDLRGLEHVRPGAEVTLWGEGLPVEEIAAACGTISYELLCKLTRRVRFEYRDEHG